MYGTHRRIHMQIEKLQNKKKTDKQRNDPITNFQNEFYEMTLLLGYKNFFVKYWLEIIRLYFSFEFMFVHFFYF